MKRPQVRPTKSVQPGNSYRVLVPGMVGQTNNEWVTGSLLVQWKGQDPDDFDPALRVGQHTLHTISALVVLQSPIAIQRIIATA